jgi:broad specificity phosphatase PhoE
MTPLAGHHGLDVELAAEVGEGGPSAAAVDLVRDLVSDETIVVCTHGDVIAEVLVTLADEDRVDLGAHPRQAKGSVWALEGGGRKFVHAEYFPPAVPGPA